MITYYSITDSWYQKRKYFLPIINFVFFIFVFITLIIILSINVNILNGREFVTIIKPLNYSLLIWILIIATKFTFLIPNIYFLYKREDNILLHERIGLLYALLCICFCSWLIFIALNQFIFGFLILLIYFIILFIAYIRADVNYSFAHFQQGKSSILLQLFVNPMLR